MSGLDSAHTHSHLGPPSPGNSVRSASESNDRWLCLQLSCVSAMGTSRTMLQNPKTNVRGAAPVVNRVVCCVP